MAASHVRLTKTMEWSGHQKDFDALYVWAGKKDLMEDPNAPDGYTVSAYNLRNGWFEVPAKAVLIKVRDGLEITKATEEAAAAEEEKPAVEKTETKDEGKTSPIETKPAVKATTPAVSTK